MDQLPAVAREYLIFQNTLWEVSMGWEVSTGLARDEIINIVLGIGALGGALARKIDIIWTFSGMVTAVLAFATLGAALERFRAAVPS